MEIESGIIHFFRRRDPKHPRRKRYEFIIQITHKAGKGYDSQKATFFKTSLDEIWKESERICKRIESTKFRKRRCI